MPSPAWTLSADDLETGEPVERFVAGGRLVGAPAPGAEALPGRYVLAGLVDAHAHLALDLGGPGRPAGDPDVVTENLAAHLRAGVLLARDVGAPVGVRVGGSHDDGPHVLAAGRFLAPPNRYLPGLFEGVAPDDLVPVALAELAASGSGWVKLVFDFPDHFTGMDTMPFSTPNYANEVLEAFVAAVHAAGGRVAAHVAGQGDGEAAVALGIDSVEHGHDLPVASLPALGRAGGAWTPTLTTVWEMGLRHAPFAAEQEARYRELLAQAGAAGVTVLAGSDAAGAGTVVDEIVLLAELGLSPVDALAAGSWAARAFLGQPGLRLGDQADLVTFDADPREDLDALRRPAAVLRKGRRVR